jgi:EpsI family protein
MDRKAFLFRVAVVCVVLFATSGVIHRTGSGVAHHFAKKFDTALPAISGWESFDLRSGLSDQVVTALDTDDVFFRTYRKGDADVTVYIGYYYALGKAGMAHSPLVCFPGQGWKTTGEEVRTIPVDGLPGAPVKANSIIVQKGPDKQLVLFWFQAYDRSFPSSFHQKLWTLWMKIRYGVEENAFVRVSVPFEGEDLDRPLHQASEFLQIFYPAFLTYIRGAAQA